MSPNISALMMATVSIIIKALNEENNIARAIESSLDAVSSFTVGEVVLADSKSTDRTVEIARCYPIKIAQLLSEKDRSCGAGAQLGFIYAQGQYLYILDGDMEISSEFLQEAVRLMEQNSEIAGVGGLVREMNIQSLEFQARSERGSQDMQAGEVDHLAMGGLYRRSAVESLGYLTNRNLHSYEEFELGIRLRAAGWRLMRLPMESVKHYGHTLPEYKLLKRRWKSRYIDGVGELLRSAIGRPHLRLLFKELKELRLYSIVILWWIILGALLSASFVELGYLWGALLIFMLPFFVMLLKKRRIDRAVYSVVAWQCFSWGLVRGFWGRQKSPEDKIPSQLL